jgi:hypothetical protein
MADIQTLLQHFENVVKPRVEANIRAGAKLRDLDPKEVLKARGGGGLKVALMIHRIEDTPSVEGGTCTRLNESRPTLAEPNRFVMKNESRASYSSARLKRRARCDWATITSPSGASRLAQARAADRGSYRDRSASSRRGGRAFSFCCHAAQRSELEARDFLATELTK